MCTHLLGPPNLLLSHFFFDEVFSPFFCGYLLFEKEKLGVSIVSTPQACVKSTLVEPSLLPPSFRYGISCSPSCPLIHSVAQCDLGHLILLPPLLTCCIADVYPDLNISMLIYSLTVLCMYTIHFGHTLSSSYAHQSPFPSTKSPSHFHLFFLSHCDPLC